MIWNRPLSSVVLADLLPVPRFSVLTLAFGITPPDGSVTVPPIAPSVVDCPLAEGVVSRYTHSAKIKPATKKPPVILFMEVPLSEIRMSAIRATERSAGRYRRVSLPDGRAVFLNPISLPESHQGIIEWLCF